MRQGLEGGCLWRARPVAGRQGSGGPAPQWHIDVGRDAHCHNGRREAHVPPLCGIHGQPMPALELGEQFADCARGGRLGAGTVPHQERRAEALPPQCRSRAALRQQRERIVADLLDWLRGLAGDTRQLQHRQSRATVWRRCRQASMQAWDAHRLHRHDAGATMDALQKPLPRRTHPAFPRALPRRTMAGPAAAGAPAAVQRLGSLHDERSAADVPKRFRRSCLPRLQREWHRRNRDRILGVRAGRAVRAHLERWAGLLRPQRGPLPVQREARYATEPVCLVYSAEASVLAQATTS